MPLTAVTLGDVQAFSDSQVGVATYSKTRMMAAIKSLLALGPRTGYLPLNVGAAVKLLQSKDTLAELILTETDVHRMLALKPGWRNQILLRLLYVAGLRVSEVAKLRWRDLQPRIAAGQVSVFGKGPKTRVVLLPSAIWRELLRFHQHAALDAPVFASGRGERHLHPSSIWRLVIKAAERAGLEGAVSPHFMPWHLEKLATAEQAA